MCVLYSISLCTIITCLLYYTIFLLARPSGYSTHWLRPASAHRRLRNSQKTPEVLDTRHHFSAKPGPAQDIESRVSDVDRLMASSESYSGRNLVIAIAQSGLPSVDGRMSVSPLEQSIYIYIYIRDDWQPAEESVPAASSEPQMRLFVFGSVHATYENHVI